MLSESNEGNHWHESEYQLDPHRMQVTETARQQEPDVNATENDNVPVLIVAEAVNKKKAPLKCSVAGCGKDLSREGVYYQRYRVCEGHLNMKSLRLGDGKEEHRFCQQCGKFHLLEEFDGDKRSCKRKLQEHNNRRRKRGPAAQQANLSTSDRRPRRTRRTDATSGVHSDNDANMGRSLRPARHPKFGPYAHLLPGERTTSSSSGAAPRSSEHASDSSAREEPKEATSSQDGGIGVAVMAMPATSGQRLGPATLQGPDSHSSRDCSTDLGFSAAMPSQVADLQPIASEEPDDLAWLDSAHGSSLPGMPAFAFEDGADLQALNRLNHAKGHQTSMPLPDLYTASSASVPSGAQQLLQQQALHAQLANHPALLNNRPVDPPAVAASWPASPQANANLQALSLSSAQRAQPSQPAQWPRAESPGISSQLAELQRTVQLQRDQIERLQALEALNWQKNFANKEQLSQPQMPASPITRAMELDDIHRLDNAPHDDNMLMALSVLLDGSSTPIPSSEIFPPSTEGLPYGGLDLRPDPSGSDMLSHSKLGPYPSAAQSLQHAQQQQQQLLQHQHHQQHLQQHQQRQQQQQQQQRSKDCMEHCIQTPSHERVCPSGSLYHPCNDPSCPAVSRNARLEAVEPTFAMHNNKALLDSMYHQQQSLDLGHFGGLSHSAPMPAPSFSQHYLQRQAHSEAASYSGSRLQQQQQKQMLWQQQHQRQQQELFRSRANANSELPARPAQFTQQNMERNLAGLDKGHLQMPQGLYQQQQLQAMQSAPMPRLPTSLEQAHVQSMLRPSLDPHAQQEGVLLDSLLRPASQLPARAPTQHQPTRDAGQYMGRLKLKMLDHAPNSIPSLLMPHLNALTPDQQFTFIEGHMRSGCVHLVVDIMCSTNPALWDVTAAVYRLLAFDAFWRQGAFLMQLPSGAAKWVDGRLTRFWNSQELLSAMPQLLLGSALLPCIVAGQAATLHVQGQKPNAGRHAGQKLQGHAKVLGRFLGKFVINPDLLACPACLAGSIVLPSASPDQVVVPGLCGVGLLTLEAEYAGLLSAAQPIVVAPDAAIQHDVCSLVRVLRAAGHAQGVLNQLLVAIGMVLQYHDPLLEDDFSSQSDDANDPAADWEAAWGDSTSLSSQESDVSDMPASENSTHCGVLSAAASAAAHSTAGSMTYMSDDEATSDASFSRAPVEGLSEGPWRAGPGLSAGAGTEPVPAELQHEPFTHPLYIAQVVQAAKYLLKLCLQHDLPALLAQVQPIAFGTHEAARQQSSSAPPSPSTSDGQLASTADSNDSAAPATSAAAAAAANNRFVLPTILESSAGSSSGSGRSQVSSEFGRHMPGSPRSSAGHSEYGFDTLDLPDQVVETAPSTSESGQQPGTTRLTTDASGRKVLTVFVPEEVRVLKDSAKEVHEDGGPKTVKDASGDDVPADAEAAPTPNLSSLLRGASGFVAQRLDPVVPARLHPFMRPQRSIDEVTDGFTALVFIMMLCTCLLAGYAIHMAASASPRLAWGTFSSLLLVLVVRLVGAALLHDRLLQLAALHPSLATAYRAVLPYFNYLRTAWLQACSGNPEQWDMVHSCAASCLSLAMILVTPRNQATVWPFNVLLPSLIVLSIAPASAWAIDRHWFLAHRCSIHIATRSCTLVVLCIALTGSFWALPWLLLALMHPVEGGAHQQVLSLTEALVVLCQAGLMCVGHNPWSGTFLQGVLLLACASCKLITLMHCVMAGYLEHLGFNSPDEI